MRKEEKKVLREIIRFFGENKEIELFNL